MHHRWCRDVTSVSSYSTWVETTPEQTGLLLIQHVLDAFDQVHIPGQS